MRSIVGLVARVAGVGCVVAGGFVLAAWVGWVVLGVVLVLVGYEVDG